MPESKFKKFVRTNGPTLAIAATGVALTSVAIWGQKSRDAAYTQWLADSLRQMDGHQTEITTEIVKALQK